ncbi:MAG: hypothetical protein U0U25_12090 [Flavobacteriales bacterium]
MMRLIIISTVVVMFLSECLLAQELPPLNTVHQSMVQGPAVGVSVRQGLNGYLLWSIQRGYTGSNFSPFCSRVQLNGMFEAEMEVAFGWNAQPGVVDPVATARVHGGYHEGVTMAFSTSTSVRYDSAFYIRYSSTGDTMFTRFLMADSILVIRRCVQAGNGDLLFTGLHEPPKEQFCLRTDSLGVVKDWFAFPGFDGRGISLDDAGFIYLAGNWITPNPRGSLIKCDSTGAVHWFQLQPLGVPTVGWYYSVVTGVGRALVLGAFIQQQFPLPEVYYAHALCYSSDGTLMWQDTARTTSMGSSGTSFIDGYMRGDDQVVACGSYLNLDEGGFGFIRSYTWSGDVLWDRQYTYYDTAGSVRRHVFNDIEPTSDGGMVLTGEAWNDEQQAPQNIWLVKLDSLGCLVPGCQEVGVQEFVLGLQEHLHISPNPASDLVNVLLELPEGGAVEGTVQVYVMDALSRVIFQEDCQVERSRDLKAAIDVSALPSSTYYLHLRDGKRWLAGGKVVVQH